MPHPGILAIAVLVAGSSTADASVPLAATSTGGTGSGFLAGIAARELADDSVPTDDCPPSCTQSCSDNNSQVLPTVISIPIIVVLVMMSGLFSGLTLGLMGLDIIGLEIVQKGENLELRNCAAKIAPLRKKGNQLLCTLLLGNVAVNSALSILTAEIADGLVGFLVSTALIVVFGEILPQAACSRYALQVGARTVPIVRFLMVSFSPLAWPISILLDWLLGQEVGTVHSRTELMEMLKLQIRLGATDEESGMVARQVAEGALCFRDKRVEDVMTPLNDAYMLSLETRLDYDTIREIFEHGFSRVPVFGKDKHDYKGLLYTKDLMLADPEDEMKLGDFISIFNRKVESFFKNTKLADVLNRFKKGGTHMGLVRETNMDSATDPVVEICGVLTLEDVMEEILQEEIVDETDVYVSVDKHNRVSDGRETNKPNLGVFNPVWRGRNTDDRLSREEIAAIAAHLSKSVFTEDSLLKLTMRAIEWLVSVSTVQNRERSTPLGLDTPSDSEDIIYHKGLEYDKCTLVLQGRISMRVGREGFQCEAGAFSILAKDALCPGKLYLTDFTAHLSTMRSRLLLISKERFLEAQLLDMTPAALDEAISNLAQQNAGESARRGGRAGTVRRMRDLGPPCDTNQYSVRTYETDSPRLPFERNIGSPRGPSSPRRPPLTEASTRTPTVETAETTVSSVSGSAPASLPFNNRSRGRKAGKGPKEEVRGDVLSATSHLFAFCASEEHLKSEVLHTQRLIAKLMSLFYCMALQSVAISDDTNFQIIDTEGLDPAEVCYLANAPDPPVVLMHWIQRIVVSSSRERILDISPPVLTRVFHELSNAVVAMHDASKISDTPFPFAFAQMIAWMLATQFVITPLICSSMTDSVFLAGGGAFIAVFLTFSMNLIASEIELPFGTDPNDLPLADMQQTMNVSLMTLLHPQTQTTPTMKRGRPTLRVSMWQDCLSAAESELPGLRAGQNVTVKEGEEESSSLEYGPNSSGGSSRSVVAFQPVRSIWPAAMTGMTSVRSDRSSSTIAALPSHSKFAHQQLKMQLRQGKIDFPTMPFHVDVPHPCRNGLALASSSGMEKNEVSQAHLTTDGFGHAVSPAPPLSPEASSARTQRRCRFSDHDAAAELNDSPRCAEDPTYENPLRVVGKHTSAKVSLGASVLQLRPIDEACCKKASL